MNQPPKGRILVIRGGAIGDFILTLPAIAALRQHFAEAHIEVLGYPHIVQLAVAGGLVNRAQSIESRALAGFFAKGGTLAEDLADYLSEFDLIISYLYDPDRIFQTNVSRCTTAQFIVGPHRPDERGEIHATKVYLKPLERLAIFDADHEPRLAVTPLWNTDGPTNDSAKDSTRGVKVLALHPGSGSERKNWPEAKWASLLERVLASTSLSLLLVGGEAEGERLRRLAAAHPPARVRVAQNLPLTELARLLSGCTAFVGHDSGISHLAAAVGLPGVVLWGDTVEDVWRPQSPKMRVLRSRTGLTGLKVEEVLEALNLGLS